MCGEVCEIGGLDARVCCILSSTWSASKLSLCADFVDQIYLYAGLAVDNKHETGFIAKEIRKHNYQTMVRLFTSLDDATVRSVLWQCTA